MDNLKDFLNKNKIQVISIVGAFMLVGVILNGSIYGGIFDIQANILANIKSAPFDGTIYPVKKVPDWVALSSSEWKLPYDQIPTSKLIDFPEYIPSQLTIPGSSLNYSKAPDKAIRDAQVTFSVPYMGNYKLEGQEYAGSHLAVDIKIPMGTPIFAIANGVVIKAANEPGGFGINAVIRHDDAPSINNANTKTTYYSGYAHMSKILVNVGDIVTKGQQIGESGQTGTATTPHLHFQIDNDQAPWHMYWPFTGKEASDAGLGFFEAINAGLGKDKALATTISPLTYVQKYMNSSLVNSTNSNTVTTSQTTTTITTVTNNTQTNTNTSSNLTNLGELPPIVNNNSTTVKEITSVITPVAVNTVAPAFASFDLKYENSFNVGAVKTIKLIALDVNGNVMNNFAPNGEINVRLENGSASLSKTYLNSNDFSQGIANFSFTPTAKFGLKISFIYNGQTKSTELMQDLGFNDLNKNTEQFVAVNFLKSNNIVQGYADGTFKPDKYVSRVEALKFIYEGLNKTLLNRSILEFSDTDSKAWYANYIASAAKDGVVKGYVGNLFKPANSVTKAEFVKMLVQSAGFNATNYVASTKQFSDVDSAAWYANYIALAKDKNLLDSSVNTFKPNQAINRGEVAEILYRTIVMKANSKIKYESNLAVNDDLVRNFYSI